MTEKPMPLFQQLVESVLTTPGDTTPQLRATLAQYATQLCNNEPLDDTSIPSDLETYVKKVALYAYRVTDQDIAQLRNNGESWDAIFEITLSVALGAGKNCLMQGLTAMREAKNALEEH